MPRNYDTPEQLLEVGRAALIEILWVQNIEAHQGGSSHDRAVGQARAALGRIEMYLEFLKESRAP